MNQKLPNQLSVKDVAALLSRTPRHVRNMVETGVLPPMDRQGGWSRLTIQNRICDALKYRRASLRELERVGAAQAIQRFKMPSLVKSSISRYGFSRNAWAMLVTPYSRGQLIAALRNAANTCGAWPVRTWLWSSPKLTSRT